jgi:hypothetical protein
MVSTSSSTNANAIARTNGFLFSTDLTSARLLLTYLVYIQNISINVDCCLSVSQLECPSVVRQDSARAFHLPSSHLNEKARESLNRRLRRLRQLFYLAKLTASSIL